MYLCVQRREDSALTKNQSWKQVFQKTVSTLHSEQINKRKNFMRTKFILLPKTCDKVSNEKQLLLLYLVFMYLGVKFGNFKSKILNV